MTKTTINNRRTQKEIKPMIKKDIEAFVVKLMKDYPEIAHSSLIEYTATEVRWAMEEIEECGKVKTNKERWG